MLEWRGTADERLCYMTRSELIDILAMKQPHVSIKHIEQGVKNIFEQMAVALENGLRIEIRGFGSFALRHRPSRTARNPKTGEYVMTEEKFAPHFKPGKELRERVNESVMSKEEN